jgi:hypothetical protein
LSRTVLSGCQLRAWMKGQRRQPHQRQPHQRQPHQRQLPRQPPGLPQMRRSVMLLKPRLERTLGKRRRSPFQSNLAFRTSAVTTTCVRVGPGQLKRADRRADRPPRRAMPQHRQHRKRHPRTHRPLYEVAPGDTVTLTEPTMLSLGAVVTTGANVTAKAARTERAMAPQSVARPDAAAAATPDSQRGAVLQSAPVRTPAPPPPAPVRHVEVANGVTTISWTDATTRNLLKLSGRMSEARLEQIKIRIEKERAAAAKKTP